MWHITCVKYLAKKAAEINCCKKEPTIVIIICQVEKRWTSDVCACVWVTERERECVRVCMNVMRVSMCVFIMGRAFALKISVRRKKISVSYTSDCRAHFPQIVIEKYKMLKKKMYVYLQHISFVLFCCCCCCCCSTSSMCDDDNKIAPTIIIP